MENKVKITNYFKNLGMIFYFLILGIERTLAVIFGFTDKHYSFFNDGGFGYYTHILTIISLILAFAFLNKQFIYMVICLFTNKNKHFEKLNYKKITIASGIILFGGMVHTNWTNLIIQFISYGFLILSMLMVTLEENKKNINRLKIWLDFVYLVSFAMAIPVAYKIETESIKVFLETYQCIGSFLLVSIYTYYIYFFYKNDSKINNNIFIFGILLMVDLPIFILRLKESLNIFLIVFPIICLIILIIEYIKNISFLNIR